MEQKFLTRQQLESFSTSDLLALADDYGIDIPQDLCRRFIIEEILESSEELRQDENSDKDVTFTEDVQIVDSTLPKTYNETRIHAILHNPAWIFVFWDIQSQTLEKLKQDFSFEHLLLRIVLFDSIDAEKPSDSIEVKVSLEEREQYVLLSSNKKSFVINLESCNTEGETSILAYTKRINVPSECKTVTDMQPGKELNISELVRLSGMEELLRKQYLTHRQSLSK